jgi:hypothetical protein
MPNLPIPNRCIWCHREPPVIDFNLSHVLPECVGNQNQHTLPPGVVCRSCNNYFGVNVEPKLLSDPFFHVIAVVLSLVDPDDMNVFRNKLFDENHQPIEPPQRSLDLSAQVNENEISLDVAYAIRGRISRTYTRRELMFLSRAIHKIAFESLAWEVYVKGIENPSSLFSAEFESVRLWAREGQPQRFARPVLRRMGQNISTNWETRFWKFEKDIGLELNLFGDWYGISLTSSHADTLNYLRNWVGKQNEGIWYIADRFAKLD